jgi:ATP-dependent exoDNAse (exonuclease V) beta subunit
MKSGFSNDLLWCSPQSAPFNSLELIPVNLSKGLQNTIFKEDYIKEQALSYVDNLNLLYVAFTRAIDGMYVFVPDNYREMANNHTGNLIYSVLKNKVNNCKQVPYPTISLSNYWDEEKKIFLYENLKKVPPQKQKPMETMTMEEIPYFSRDISTVARQVIRADTYLTLLDERLSSHVSLGKVMHEVFQKIRTVEDIENALLGLVLEGKITDLDASVLKPNIQRLINEDKIKPWFSKDWNILTEATILFADGSINRPDRVLIKDLKAIVIDYKFGLSEQESYIHQVRNYMTTLKQMNYIDIEGFIWYVNLEKVLRVSD